MAIKVGDVVEVTQVVNIRETPNGVDIGDTVVGEHGDVLGGPTAVGGWTWANVTWPYGDLDTPTGWVIVNGLKVIEPAPEEPPVEPEPQPIIRKFKVLSCNFEEGTITVEEVQ